MATRSDTVLIEDSIKFGKILADPSPGEEVVISGISGRYPESENVQEFQDNLFNKVDMITGDDRRWKPGHPEIPHWSGKLPSIEDFDAGFFGFNFRQATQLDPQLRILLEVTMEAIFDAGLHPSELEGTKTGVFIGACFNENGQTWFVQKLVPHGFAVLGNTRSMLAHYTSKFLRLKGPSVVCDTACSSSSYALENAYKAIRMGECDMAIVGGAGLVLHPLTTLQFSRLGVLSPDGRCKAFDVSGNGYVRSETICAVLLQKSKDAKRIYSTVLHAKTNADGFKASGITFPSRERQQELFTDFYQECSTIKPTCLSYVEAHGTGTKVGDPEELSAIEEVFAKGRDGTLLIGSIKSNIGHTEPSSGLCSVTKAIIANETGFIPPNLHYKEGRKEVDGLHNGTFTVVTEKTPIDNLGAIGINSFGFGGANAHILLRKNTKEKAQNGSIGENVPRIVCVSGRSIDAIDKILDHVLDNNVDVEQIGLLHEVFRKNITGHTHRGYSLALKSGEIKRSATVCTNLKPSYLILCFSDIDEQSIKNAKELLGIPIALSVIQRIHDVLGPKGINILSVLKSGKNVSILESAMATFAMKILFGDILKVCRIVPDKVITLSKNLCRNGLVCAYFENILTLQEVTEYTYHLVADNIENNTMDNSSSHNSNNLQQQLRYIYEKISGKNYILKENSFNTLSEFLTNLAKNSLISTVEKRWTFFEIGNGESRTLTNEANYKIKAEIIGGMDGGINTVLSSIGRLYEIGFNPQIQNLYPKIEFPVSRGTPMISPCIKWNHSRKYFVSNFSTESSNEKKGKHLVIRIDKPEFSFMTGHVIDGRNLLPGTGYLYFVWEVLADIHGYLVEDMKIVFENCKFERATTLPKDDAKLELRIMIQKLSGHFEIEEGGVRIVSGKIYLSSKDADLLDEGLPTTFNESSLDMNKKDIYKELRLRGYYLSGQFRAMQSASSNEGRANVKWENNWVTFLDNMLQLTLLKTDTRQLYVPTSIQRIVIDAKRHTAYAEQNSIMPVTFSKETGIIRSGYIQISGLNARWIARRKDLGVPVVEKHVFVPNQASLTTKNAIRVNMQILLENLMSYKVKVAELIDDATLPESEPLGEIISGVLGDQPLIQSDIRVLSSLNLENVEDNNVPTETEYNLVVGSNILQRSQILHLAFGSTKEDGFVLSREPLDFKLDRNRNLNIISIFTNENEKLIFFKKPKNTSNNYSVIQISKEDKEFDWVSQLQNEIRKAKQLIVYAQNEPLNGILGLVSCIRREIGGQNIKLFYTDAAPDFDINNTFYADQLNKGLAVNIFKDGTWGTYRHLLLGETDIVKAEHCYSNSLRRGDLSSLVWMEGPLKLNQLNPKKEFVEIHCSSINFRDVMVASGKINADSLNKNRKEQECVQGIEFAGYVNGRRVMGIANGGALATILEAERSLLWDIPEEWSLEEAVTVPIVYATSIVGLITKGNIRRGESVLIHSGAGGVGLSAIQIALFLGCTVYTTVGIPEKREFLKKKFPQLKDHHIFNSRTIEFEKDVMNATKGRGVDLILNSLAEEKLIASVRCLAQGGRFIEIGKFDLANGNILNLLLLEKDATFHGVMIDHYVSSSDETRLELHKLVKKYLEIGAIRPLPRTTFKKNEIEAAFRYMATGKNIGKVVVQIRNLENSRAAFFCLPRYNCDNDKTYIICGGLGGFGLELADWLILRGCNNLVLTSRYGIKTGYQAYRISVWKSYGCNIKISTDNITTYEGCLNLIETSNKLGPVHAIFNLAVVLNDAIFENQTKETFKTSFGPKAIATEYLDIISRKMCPQLRDFVVFSSVSCGRGNAGQTNYGMANSVMERICEKRKSEGFPGLAIQWGAIGEVGLVADMQEEAIEIEIGGTLQQRISNCLGIMDQLLKQKESAIVSSIVVAEKKSHTGGDNIVEAVANILGIEDIKSVPIQATLAEVGMDSMTGIEIQQTLDREYEVFLSAQDIKVLTFAKLLEIQAERSLKDKEGFNREQAPETTNAIIQFIPSEENATEIILPINGKSTQGSYDSTVILFPGVDGSIKILEPLYKNITANLVGLQYPHSEQKDTLEEMGALFLPILEERISKETPFQIVSYSYGSLIALETVKLLEQKGYYGTLIIIDGSPNYIKALLNMFRTESDDILQVDILVYFATLVYPSAVIAPHLDSINKCNSFEEKIDYSFSAIQLNSVYSEGHLKNCVINCYKRIKSLLVWTPKFKLKSEILLFKPTLSSVDIPDEISSLAELSERPVDVKTFTGNHVTILENTELADAINMVLNLKQ